MCIITEGVILHHINKHLCQSGHVTNTNTSEEFYNSFESKDIENFNPSL